MLPQWRLHLTLVGSAVLVVFNGPAICENPGMNWFLGGRRQVRANPLKKKKQKVKKC